MFKIDNEITEWSKQAFPDLTVEWQLKKLDEELAELTEAVKKGDAAEELKETADVYIVARILLDRFQSHIGGYFIGLLGEYPVENLEEAVEKKMEINRNRKWNRTNGVYKHEEKTE